MAVIINELEVVVDQPAEPAPTAAAAPAPGGPGVPLAPQDLRDVFRQQAERLARVRAH